MSKQTTEAEYQQEEAARKAAAALYEAKKPEALAAALKGAKKVLAQVRKAAKAHGHNPAQVPAWGEHWRGSDEAGNPVVELQQEVYCTECFRSCELYVPDNFKQEGHRHNLESRLCKEACGPATSKAAQKDCEKMEAIHDLRRLLKPGTTVWTNLRSVSSSGMSRHISVHTISHGRWNGKPETNLRDISGMVARALGYKQGDRDGALVVGGCGMDMGFHVVYSLSSTLYWYVKDPNPESAFRSGGGGYTLKQHWL
jgi:hypothetical protein